MSYPIQVLRPVRRVGLPQRARYGLYKAELREDFFSRCGYCDTPDYYSGGKRGFHIDHFAPKSKFEFLKNEYSNLVYCCPVCNIGKSNDWPGHDHTVSVVGNSGYVDPCDRNYHSHLVRSSDGLILAVTPLGRYIHKRLKLNLRRRQICWLLEKMEVQQVELAKMISKKDFGEDDREQVLKLCELVSSYFKYVGMLKRE